MGEIGPTRDFGSQKILCLPVTAMGDVLTLALLWLSGMVTGVIAAINIFHVASNAAVSCHGYRRGQWPSKYFTEPALLWLAGTVMGEVRGQ